MSRFHCPKCGEATSTTGTPNKVEGMFISDADIEALEVEIECEPVGIYLPGLMKKLGAVRGHRCPKCNTVELD